MVPVKNKTYYIEFTPVEKFSSEFSYTGVGVYKGEKIKDKDQLLFLMEDLRTSPGFSSVGWFTSEDIKHEVLHEQKT